MGEKRNCFFKQAHTTLLHFALSRIRGCDINHRTGNLSTLRVSGSYTTCVRTHACRLPVRLGKAVRSKWTSFWKKSTSTEEACSLLTHRGLPTQTRRTHLNHHHRRHKQIATSSPRLQTLCASRWSPQLCRGLCTSLTPWRFKSKRPRAEIISTTRRSHRFLMPSAMT